MVRERFVAAPFCGRVHFREITRKESFAPVTRESACTKKVEMNKNDEYTMRKIEM